MQTIRKLIVWGHVKRADTGKRFARKKTWEPLTYVLASTAHLHMPQLFTHCLPAILCYVDVYWLLGWAKKKLFFEIKKRGCLKSWQIS